MKYLLLILTSITVINANDNYVKEKNNENLERIKKEQQLSQREKDYLKYKRELEAENEKLEEEGFCSCNND